ncbi:MAG TPA: hypothetical protein VFS58_13925 [Steroidobacteraceae bacterium]|nr:hypothetical protein [Steroidobacteraceae bacterium]
MPEPLLPVDAASGDDRHRDVRQAVFAVVPQRRAPFGKRVFWRVVLFVAQFPTGLRLMKRLRG